MLSSCPTRKRAAHDPDQPTVIDVNRPKLKPSTHILLALLAALALDVALAPAVKLVADAAVCRSRCVRRALHFEPTSARNTPGRVVGGAYDFTRVAGPLFLLLALAGLFARRKAIGAAGLLRRGFRTDRGPWRNLLAGLSVGLASVAAVTLILWLAGVRDFHAPAQIARRSSRGLKLISALVAALGAGVFEEAIFRGLLLAALLRDRRFLPAILIADVVFALPHFFSRAAVMPVGFDPWAGFHAMSLSVTRAMRPDALLLCIGMLAAGALLCLAFAWSGRLYLGIGLHTGWVLAGALSCVFMDKTLAYPDMRWLFGGRRVLDGLIGWALIPLVAAWMWRFTRKYRTAPR